MAEPETEDRVRIGRIGRPHGVHGAVTIILDDPASGCLDHVREISIQRQDGSFRAHSILHLHWIREGRAAMKLSGIRDRDEASRLTHLPVLVTREQLHLDPSELLVSDLVGLEVICDETVVGAVHTTYHNGVHDVMVVSTDSGWVDYPVTEDHVLGLDDAGRLVVRDFQAYLQLAHGVGSRSKR